MSYSNPQFILPLNSYSIMKKYLIYLILLPWALFAEHPESLLDRYESVFTQLPEWEKKLAKIQPFGDGSTNQNYLLTLDQQQYFIRLGSQNRNVLGLDFLREYTTIQFAAELDLSPRIVASDPDHEILVMPFIKSDPVDLHKKEHLLETIPLIKKLHTSNHRFDYSANPEEIIKSYLSKIEELKIQLSPSQRKMVDARPKLTFYHLVPCHLDLWDRNVLNDGKRFWIIDWEYGAMSEDLFDLASLASADFFTDEEMDTLIMLYEGRPSIEKRQRLQQLRILADIRWALWSLIQDKVSEIDLPYLEWADKFFSEAKKRINN